MSTVTTLKNLEFTITDGSTIKFPEICKGKKTVLYFYPKDDTPGCTVQACSYRDHLEDFTSKNIQIFGVSRDDKHSHRAFSEKFSLNFPLIVDSEGLLADALGVSGRDSFLLDGNASVILTWKGVSPQTTVSETLEKALEI